MGRWGARCKATWSTALAGPLGPTLQQGQWRPPTSHTPKVRLHAVRGQFQECLHLPHGHGEPAGRGPEGGWNSFPEIRGPHGSARQPPGASTQLHAGVPSPTGTALHMDVLSNPGSLGTSPRPRTPCALGHTAEHNSRMTVCYGNTPGLPRHLGAGAKGQPSHTTARQSREEGARPGQETPGQAQGQQERERDEDREQQQVSGASPATAQGCLCTITPARGSERPPSVQQGRRAGLLFRKGSNVKAAGRELGTEPLPGNTNFCTSDR